jgi:hypothetical protein
LHDVALVAERFEEIRSLFLLFCCASHTRSVPRAARAL